VSDFDLRVLSLGAGVQSSTLYWLADAGVIGPKPDVAIFADTQQEPPWVYDTLDYIMHNGTIPVHVTTAGDIGEALESGVNNTGQRFAALPFWMSSEGVTTPGRRQCTREYKIDVIIKETRRLLGYGKGERIAGKATAESWIGISIDEAHRAKPSRNKWITHRWPLLFDRPMRRGDCLAWMKAQGHPIPKKSACLMCPFRKTIEYARWREEEPELFDRAVKFDHLIRSTGTMSSGGNRMKNEQFVSRLLVPLDEIPTVKELEGDDSEQIDLFGNECEGMCGV
jgi:hypothetical protein